MDMDAFIMNVAKDYFDVVGHTEVECKIDTNFSSEYWEASKKFQDALDQCVQYIGEETRNNIDVASAEMLYQYGLNTFINGFKYALKLADIN